MQQMLNYDNELDFTIGQDSQEAGMYVEFVNKLFSLLISPLIFELNPNTDRLKEFRNVYFVRGFVALLSQECFLR